MTIEVFSYEIEEINDNHDTQLSSWSDLWYSDLEEARVSSVVIAWDGDDVVGFQSINGDGLCVAIEVKDTHQGQGISRLMIEESGCTRPERNENPDFWAAAADW